MRYSILFSILILFLSGCNKNKFNTIPSLIVKSINTTVLSNHQLLVITLSFTDAEGDLTDTLYIQKRVLGCVGSGFKDSIKLPAFPTTKNQDGDIIVTYGYNVNGYQDLKAPRCFRNDTATFRFVLRDNAKHKSDTAVTDKIVIVY